MFKRTKYGVRTDKAGVAARTVDNIRFDSIKEAKRYSDLKLLVRAGEITGLEADKKQLKWKLEHNGVKIGSYTADFSYFKKDGAIFVKVVEDVKGYRTREYTMKKRLMKALHGIEIQEV